MTAAPVRVVIVEDSLVQRAHLVGMLEHQHDITVVGEATTAPEAIELVARLRPDVVTLDLNIPDGGGQYALERIMAATPTPILVLSSTVQHGASTAAIEALAAGAVLALPKPARWTETEEHELRRSVRTISRVHVIIQRRRRASQPSSRPMPGGPSTAASRGSATGLPGAPAVVAIGASTGGPAALATVLAGFAGLTASVLVVQHIHAEFIPGLVKWMARVSALPVEQAVTGQVVRPGRVYISPGGVHLRLRPGLRLELNAEPASLHRPSVNELFASVSELTGLPSVGVLLTGMGEDGARGLLAMRRRGARTIAQDEASCAVYGMPQAACRLGAVDHVLPLPDIAERILKLAREVMV